MYAVIETGGKQYTVRPSSVIEVNCLNKEVGEAFETDKVLLLQPSGEGVRIGQPYVRNAKVQGVVLRQFRGKKVLIFKQRRRKNYRRTGGHRQELTLLRIEHIEADGVVESMPVKTKAKPEASVAPAPTTAQLPAESPVFEIYDSSSPRGIEVKARARYIKGKFVVQKGSQGLVLEPDENLSVEEKERYESLCKEGILVENAEKGMMEFSKEWVFGTPRAAAIVVHAGDLEGSEDRWKVPEEGKPYAKWKTLGQWQDEQPKAKAASKVAIAKPAAKTKAASMATAPKEVAEKTTTKPKTIANPKSSAKKK